jgi:hypothetical protein
MHLPYLAAQQAVERLSSEQFEVDSDGIEMEAPSRMDGVRANVAVVLRWAADRVEPMGVRSSP